MKKGRKSRMEGGVIAVLVIAGIAIAYIVGDGFIWFLRRRLRTSARRPHTSYTRKTPTTLKSAVSRTPRSRKSVSWNSPTQERKSPTLRSTTTKQPQRFTRKNLDALKTYTNKLYETGTGAAVDYTKLTFPLQYKTQQKTRSVP
jgi:hypothetical protein